MPHVLEALALDALDLRRYEVFAAVREHGTCWEIREPGGGSFVIGPESFLSGVLGLYGEEYGWPVRVEAEAEVASFVPGERRHPFIHERGEIVAVCVSRREYDDLCGAT